MSWQRVALHSARVVSHRAVTFGEDQPDSAIRQVVVRLVSTQAFNIAHSTGAPRHTSRTSSVRSAQGLPWIPDEVKNLKKNQARSEDPRAEVSGRVVEAVKGQPEKVVEYLVLQKRVLNGAEDSTWKIWGFAEESTPERLLSDAQYWSKTLDAHTA
jgi:protein MBA1